MPDDITFKPTLETLPGFHDPFSSMSHLLGAVIFAFLGYGLLLRGRGDRARMAYLSIYAFSCVLMFAMSGVYHMMTRGGAARAVLGRLDHCAIFVLIAGTFTPAHGLLLDGWQRRGPLAAIWIGAIIGIVLKSVFYTDVPEWFSLAFYLTLGWFGAVSGYLIARHYGFRFVVPLLWGGIAYSIGGVIDVVDEFIVVPGIMHAHEIFHLAVLAGAGLHWYWVWQFADGKMHQRSAQPPREH